MDEIILQNSCELAELAKQINEAHLAVETSFGHSLAHAIRAGELLNQAKESCPHGTWEYWLEKNIKFSRSYAHVYRNIASNKGLLLSNIQKTGYLSLDAALRLAKGGMPMLQSMSNDWWTPKQYIDAVYEVMGGIDLDPASTEEANKTVGAKTIYTEDNDGLSQIWQGRVFLNPPYGNLCREFIGQFYEFWGSSVVEAVILVNANSVDTDWFQPLFTGVMCFTDHRINFNSPYGEATASTHGNCFIYFGPNEEKFAAVFEKFGNIVKRWP